MPNRFFECPCRPDYRARGLRNAHPGLSLGGYREMGVRAVVIKEVVAALVDCCSLRDASGISQVENMLIPSIFETCVTEGRTHGQTE